jgi:hypothetical protein
MEPSPATIQPDGEFFGRLRMWVDKWEEWSSANPDQSNSCDFFFFGPEHLPVFGPDTILIQEFWKDNLVGKHVNYNVFWVLEGCDLHEFRSAIITLRKIDTQARFCSNKPPEAKLRIRSIAIEDRPDNEVLKFYKNARKTLQQDHDEKAVLKLEEPQYLVKDQKWIQVLRIGTEIPLMVGRVKWSMPESLSVPPPDFSACRLANMSWRIDGTDAITGWAFHGKDKTSELVKYIDSITATPRANEKSVIQR